METSLFETDLTYIKGVGPKKAQLLATELGISTAYQLLLYFPFRYIDRSAIHLIKNIQSDAVNVQIKGVIKSVELIAAGSKKRLVAKLADESGVITLVWFQGLRWAQNVIEIGKEFIVFGKPSFFGSQLSIVHPELETEEKEAFLVNHLQPVYSLTEKLRNSFIDSKGIGNIVKTILSTYYQQIPETLPEIIIKKHSLITRLSALKNIHFPSNTDSLNTAIARLKYEELFYLQFGLLHTKAMRATVEKGFVFEKVGEMFNTFYTNHLPFTLTNAQKRVVKEIRSDVSTGKLMNRLIQGDVGSGKTVVSLFAMLLAIDNGFQACLMAPTEILAQQHFATIQELLNGLPLKVSLLTGSVKIAARRTILQAVADGEIHILIGTHALIEPTVVFKNLGIAIIDEQHRFGVEQRAKLWQKNKLLPPHILVMTATPIPRTLAMTTYGDLDISIIDELPPGRKDIKTVLLSDKDRLRIFRFMHEQIKLGRQVYVVFPMIELSEKMDLKYLEDGYESLSREFKIPDYQIAVVHGKMKADQKKIGMDMFIDNRAQIMVATTVIEVGVNVPNASIMVIESAERFGLSQLHQLRGRVGRGAEQSYCLLVGKENLSYDARKRLKTMCETNDGFVISEVDMELRGPGEISGTKQSGVAELKIANLLTDQKIIEEAREDARFIINEKNITTKNEFLIAFAQYKKLYPDKANWSRIS